MLIFAHVGSFANGLSQECVNLTDNNSDRGRAGNVKEFTVTELANAIKRTVEHSFGHVRLRGEISGYRGPHSSGHCYFTIKDDKARIDAVVWRGVFQKLKFKPEEGLEVIATGRISTYPGSSKYQIVIESLEPAGVGALMALLEERRKKLTEEGLFAEERKIELPFLPRVVGVVTSPTGAVIRDMMHGFAERFPVRVLLWPVRVQGETSAAEVAKAIAGFNALKPDGAVPRPDVLIVARGGGSLEDLWGFNEEVVVRAVAASKIPLISAVGHETDWTLIDLAADARAPTPTKAAEWAVPKYTDLIERVSGFSERLKRVIYRALEEFKTHLISAQRGLPRMQDILALPRQRCDELANRLPRGLYSNNQGHAGRFGAIRGRLSAQPLRSRFTAMGQELHSLGLRNMQAFQHNVGRERQVLISLEQLLNSLGHHSVLSRGFTIIRDEGGNMVRSAEIAAHAPAIDIEFADGHVAAVPKKNGAGPDNTPSSDDHASVKPRRSRKLRARKSSAKDSGQGSLF